MRTVDIKQIRPVHIPSKASKVENGYAYFNLGSGVIKIGYVCPSMDIDKPIKLIEENSTTEKEIRVGKTGIYEIQSEQRIVKDEYEYGEIVEDITFNIVGVGLPIDVDFVFDYEILKTE